jgi:hypothetical protein
MSAAVGSAETGVTPSSSTTPATVAGISRGGDQKDSQYPNQN